jgi:LysR family glycine cleavage system transcriptional activator
MDRGDRAERLPALGTLRVFEAAARRLSFTAAADELAVTQAAVSHQIKALEDDLGVRLFHRAPRGLALTEEGAALFGPVHAAFDRVREGIGRVRALRRGGTLTVTASPSLAGAWLVPRLVRFHAAHPEIEVRVLASPRLVDLAAEGVDAGIRYGRGRWAGLVAEPLMREELFPVCAPAAVTGPDALRHPADLARATLVHVIPYPDDWRRWLQAAGVAGLDPERGPKLETADLAYAAAASGLGVAIGRGPLVAPLLARGALVRPFAIELPGDLAYYCIHPEGRGDLPKVRAFRDWVLAEAAGTGEVG